MHLKLFSIYLVGEINDVKNVLSSSWKCEKENHLKQNQVRNRIFIDS